MKILLLTLVCQVLSLSCLNHKKKSVDWWLMLNVRGGNQLTYLYCDSLSCDKFQYNSAQDINGDDSPLFLTIQKLDFNSDSSTIKNVAWDDAGHNYRGHSKGILHASSEKQKGFIINHSLPHFPVIINMKNLELRLPNNVGHFSQHFFCVSLGIKHIEEIAKLLTLSQIHVSGFNNVDLEFNKTYPNIFGLHESNSFIGPNSDKKLNIDVETSKDNKIRIKVFARNQKADLDIYQYIAEELDIGIISETWRNGAGGRINPYDHKYEDKGTDRTHRITNNNQIKYVKNGNEEIQFPSTVDHSKYAISDDENKPYVCISDLNWMLSQSKRGGTAWCFEHKELWNEIKESFKDIQTQPNTTTNRPRNRHPKTTSTPAPPTPAPPTPAPPTPAPTTYLVPNKEHTTKRKLPVPTPTPSAPATEPATEPETESETDPETEPVTEAKKAKVKVEAQ